MARTTAKTLPETEGLLTDLGHRLRAARLRRSLSAAIVSSRAGMSLMTLRAIENGRAGVTMGAYLAVLQTLGLEKSLALVAQEDPLGRQLQDAVRKRAPRSAKTAHRTVINTPPAQAAIEGQKPTVTVRAAAGSAAGTGSAAGIGAAVHSDDLLPLITGRRST
jgi:transcriptional regulator with XRE-family HTH domain